MMKSISSPALVLLVIACSSTQIAIEDAAKHAALLAAKPVLEKVFYAEAPIVPSNRDLFPTISKLSGSPFDPRKYFANRLQFSNGTVELPPGDYVVPVMTYCMKSSGASPSNHRYQLGKLSGKAAQIIRDVNAKALTIFLPEEIQTLSWNIQNGVPFDEMSTGSKQIVDVIIPEHRKELEKSSFKVFSEKWDGIAINMGLPRFDEITDEALNNLGDLGREIIALREFRRRLRESGGGYESLRELISLPGISENLGTEATTPWSKLSENVYARFLITGHFLDVGELQIRIISAKRTPADSKNQLTRIDISSLIADPGKGEIQPLSLSALAGMLAVRGIPASASPALIAAVIAAILADKYVDWDAFSKAAEKFGESARDVIQKGLRALSKEHDALEKPLRDSGIIDGNTKDSSKSTDGARNYEIPGGKEALERDFAKLPGREEPSPEPGIRLKRLPNGDKAVLREKPDKPFTIELQPKDAGQGNKIRVKVRYL